MGVYPSTHKIYVYTTAWIDITADVVSDIVGDWGMGSSNPMDRVAKTGNLSFNLRNDDGCIGAVTGYYSPDKAGGMTGWDLGIPVKLEITFAGEAFTRYRGYIDSISPQSGSTGDRRVTVKAVDWMNYAAKNPIALPTIAFTKDISEVVALLLAQMPVQPQHVIYYDGFTDYPTVFDTVSSRSLVMGEFIKLTNSEISFIYLQKDMVDGETLVVEGRYTRVGAVAKIPKLNVDCGNLLMEDGGALLQEMGDNIKLNEMYSIAFDNDMDNLEVGYGDSLMNYITTKNYPRVVDSAPVVLANADAPIQIPNWYTLAGHAYITLNYRDPDNPSQSVAGFDMIVPVPTTDYKYTQFADGSGVDHTAHAIVNAVYGPTSVTYDLTVDDIAYDGVWISFLQARGYGIYTYNPVEYTAEDATSQNAFGYSPVSIDQVYISDPTLGQADADTLLSQYKDPFPVVKKMHRTANYSNDNMNAFLRYDIGHMVAIKEDQTGIDDDYFINGISFRISTSGIIKYTYILRDKNILTV